MTRFLRKAVGMASVVSQAMPLELMEIGDEGVVIDVDGQSDLVVRLEEMGLYPGVKIRMIRPGSPCILEINHQRFLIRVDDAATVMVEIAR